jgi:hydroxymethylpyrimidine/phosphomethylpyrimidine kinase
MKIPRILTIAGSDSGGGAGIQADLKTISALGGYGMSAITALTAQNTLGVQGIHEVPVEFIEKQMDSVLTDIGADAVKTGMLANSEIISAIAQKMRQYRIINLVVDPVMVAKGGALLIRQEAIRSLITQLLPIARIVTPNLHEAQVLTQLTLSTPEDMKNAARKIHGMGAGHVIVKGGHLQGKALDILYDGKEFLEFEADRIETKNTHGTGCTFSAAIAVGLAQGKPVVEAVAQAKEYITTAIRFSLNIGQGHGPTDHFAALFREHTPYPLSRGE